METGKNGGPGYDDGRLIFHYSRERRLDRASERVREFNNARPPQKNGLFRTLTSTKPLTFSFVSIIILCAVMTLYAIFSGGSRASARVRGTEISVEASGAPDFSYFTIRKKISGGDPYTGAADFIVSARSGGEDGGYSVYAERVYFTLEREETFRFTVPFGGKTLYILAVLDEDKAVLKVNPR